ncbi:predicted protein [Naegleria gruberi]|uniref:Predicted protein n=1 Tax=Naegleria gruberi TaxID=5762 RepID=D2VVH9_NAEGR|nr:uncharacterized protein NAEGRDRAFT_52593 [Naegleria gruberi]EFC39115.1 predicted protein [Naegleria gruberi]|eukprot:XP_002671859.1 predicted protein [Naegleria gruberi strain NEG-M]
MYNSNVPTVVQHPIIQQQPIVQQQPIIQSVQQQPIVQPVQQPIVEDVSMRQGTNVVTVDPNAFMSTNSVNNNSFNYNNNMSITSNNNNNSFNNNNMSVNSFNNNNMNNNMNNSFNNNKQQSFDSFSSGSGGGGDSSFVMTNSMVRSIDHSVSDFPMDEISTYSSKRSTNSNSSSGGNNNSTMTSFTQKTKTIEELMQEKYSNISLLGRGGFGAVFKCDKIIKKKNAPPQTRAVKLIEFVSTDELNRSLREAFRLCGLQHENVLKVHDAYVLQMGTSGSLNDKNTMCIEMEFIPCGDLAEKILKKKICLSCEILKTSLRCMCEALLYLYEEKQMVHRDIKPHNIMIRSMNLENNELDIVLGDFGLAKSVGDSASSASFAGTLQYMSPELFMMQQGMSEEEQDDQDDQNDQETLRKHAHASDIFALGVTFYQLMSLDMNTSITGLVMKFMGDEKKLFTTLREKIAKNSSENNIQYDENFINLILNMVKRDPDERLNAEQVLEKLDEL